VIPLAFQLSKPFIGVVKKVHRGRVAVFTSGVDIAQTETKGTVLLHNAEEMLNFTTGEEKHLEKVGSSLYPTDHLPHAMCAVRSFKKFQTPASRLL
jgi:hypothetical protein